MNPLNSVSGVRQRGLALLLALGMLGTAFALLWWAGLPSIDANHGGAVARLDAPMPPIRQESLNAGAINLAPPTGVPLILNFWATWCAPCQREMPLLQALYVQGTPVIGINTGMETEATLQAWLADYAIRFPILADDERRTLETQFAIRGLPTTYFIDAQGVVRYIHQGELTPQILATGLAAIQNPA